MALGKTVAALKWSSRTGALCRHLSSKENERFWTRLLPERLERSNSSQEFLHTYRPANSVNWRHGGALRASAAIATALANVLVCPLDVYPPDKSPLDALKQGSWAKLICGASFEDAVEIRSLALIYTLAGVDCIDCACDSAIVTAVEEGIAAALRLSEALQSVSGDVGSEKVQRPLVMVSLNDDQDPHFRKAVFESEHCPSDCPRPCETICPAAAISLRVAGDGAEVARGPSNADNQREGARLEGGVIEERCYGCGRCIDVCPLGLIKAQSYVRPPDAVAALLEQGRVDAVEIHTQGRETAAFQQLWSKLGPAFQKLKLVAVSLPEPGVPQMQAMYDVMEPWLHQHERGNSPVLLWQLDGRPMSGDIGAGATRAACRLAETVLQDQSRPPGYLQLAGGTNSHTASSMERMGLLGKVAGVAFGGYARKVVYPFLSDPKSQRRLETLFQNLALDRSAVDLATFEFLEQPLLDAKTLLAPYKSFKHVPGVST